MFQVVIIGKPNVGKSTLFNTLIGEKKAIVEKTPGVTRDFLVDYIEVEDGKGFKIIDTGGIDLTQKDPFSKVIIEILYKTIEEAHLILFVVDGKEGISASDEEIANLIRKFNKQTFLVVNKVESKEDEKRTEEFYSLGFKDIFFISAKEKKNVSQLQDAIVEVAYPYLSPLPKGPFIKICVLGRPNVGKSTLINQLLGYERMLVSEIPSTTRDCVDVLLEREKGASFLLIDTPGIRRRALIKERAEKFSVSKALETLKKVDVVLFLITAEEGLTHQDKTLLRQIEKNYKAVLLLVNKWDIFENKRSKGEVFLELLKYNLKFIPWVPILHISAKKGFNLDKIFPLVEEIYSQYHMRVPTSQVNRLLVELKSQYTFNVKGKRLKFYYATQVEVAPPTFVVFINIEPEEIPKHILKFLQRRFQEALNFYHVPVRVYLRLRD